MTTHAIAMSTLSLDQTVGEFHTAIDQATQVEDLLMLGWILEGFAQRLQQLGDEARKKAEEPK